MKAKEELRKLRESTGMNRKEFCEYFEIPYMTETDWELYQSQEDMAAPLLIRILLSNLCPGFQQNLSCISLRIIRD